MKEPWFNSIAWGKLAGFMAFIALILNQLNTAPVPAAWHPWVMFAGSLVTALGGFILNPKTKDWVPDAPTEEETPAPAPPTAPTPAAVPNPPSVPALTPEQLAAIAAYLNKGQTQ